MTWTRSTQTGAKCDSPLHRGESEVIALHGTHVNAIEAFRAAGWSYNHRAGIHTCPECRLRTSKAN